MKILIVGKSAREQAFVQLLSKSPQVEKILCVPGNPAIANYAECTNIPLEDLTSICEFAKENEVDLTIASDESVIQNGITNIFEQENLKILAPTQEAAQIATSRAFAKKFLYKHKIPTLKFGVFDREASAVDYLKKSTFPIVIKYDHLAHYDSFICSSFTKAKNTVEKVFSEVGKKVVIEEYSEGETVRLGILTDSYNVIPLQYVKEYTRAIDGGGGQITKGVGAYAPSAKISSKQEKQIAQKIVFPLLDALQSAGTPYEGFLSMRLLLLPNDEIKVIEFLPTLSIPEATCVFQMIDDDIVDFLKAADAGALEDCPENLNFCDDVVVSAALISGNYPVNYKENVVVEGIEDVDEDNIELYYNDVGMNSCYEISTTGGRAFFMTARAATLTKATNDLYDNIDTIKFRGMHYRRDIGAKKIKN